MYSIGQVSEITGISTQTLRAWEKRYEIISPRRTKSGYRLYSKEQIDELNWLTYQMNLHGITISQAIELRKVMQQPESEQHIPVTFMELPAIESACQEIIQSMHKLLVELRIQELTKKIETTLQTYGDDIFFYQIIIPFMKQVGTCWQNGELTVCHEHLLSQLVMQKLYTTFSLYPTSLEQPKVLTYCAETEQHQIGLLLFSLFLRKRGIYVIDLGGNTPHTEVDHFLHLHQIDWICVSIQRVEQAPVVLNLIEKWIKEYPHLQAVIGGSGTTQLWLEPDKVEYLRTKGVHLLTEDPVNWQEWYQQQFIQSKE
ncbi:MerR family transcriptional regulator [Brevibacillus daliensis]|uniref:MerR family transcriptional regulator n=1 Tax=Brevibacillus daliensis TaxID=2892995 RepID=UPI001E319A2E|nr:MerR family transcriptional regulator [Brevibacillus daliensis]